MVEYTDSGKHARFNGETYTRDEKTGYYLCTRPCEDGFRKRLHVAVWELYNGNLPDGYQIHHKDMDKRHNEIDNLQILTAQEHMKLHGRSMSNERKEASRKNLIERAVPKASEWHRSKEGREWHVQHGKDSWKDKEQIEYNCTQCGGKFYSRKRYGKRSNHFCSNKCKAAFRRASGVDNEKRKCEICGTEFTCNKYSTRKRCEDCRHKKHQRSGKRAGLQHGS